MLYGDGTEYWSAGSYVCGIGADGHYKWTLAWLRLLHFLYHVKVSSFLYSFLYSFPYSFLYSFLSFLFSFLYFFLCGGSISSVPTFLVRSCKATRSPNLQGVHHACDLGP